MWTSQYETLVRHKFILVLILAGMAQVVVEFTLDGFTTFPDSEEYVETLQWFVDGTGEEYLLRIQRPLQMIIMMPFAPICGAEEVFKFANSAFYLLSIPFFYSFSKKVLRGDRAAFMSTLLFEFSFPVVYWGLGILTDMLLWLMAVIAFNLLVDAANTWRTIDMVKFSSVVGIGILNKESISALALIFAFLYASARARSGRGWVGARDFAFVISIILVTLPFLIVQVLMYIYFGPGHTFFDYHFIHNTGDSRGELWYVPLTFLIAFNWLLLLYPFSANRFSSDNEFLVGRAYWISIALASIPVVAFEQYSPRLAFFIFPLVLPVVALQMDSILSQGNIGRRRLIMTLLLVVSAVVVNAAAIFGDELRELLGIWPR